MNGSKFLRLLAPALSLSFYATMLLGISPAYTQPLNLKNIDFIEPANLPTLPYLGRRSQAGLHGCSCGCQQPTFTAVLPKSTLGLTTAKHPTFFFYLPKTETDPKQKSAQAAEFTLLDEQDNILYQIAFPLNNLPGTLSISLPQTFPALELDQKYYWYLEILCTQDDFSQPFVSGWLMRVPLTPELLTQLETATPEEKLAIYAKTGLWHDLFATLAQLRQTQPKNIHFATLWEDLLIQEGLEQIASKPLVDCCKFSELEK